MCVHTYHAGLCGSFDGRRRCASFRRRPPGCFQTPQKRYLSLKLLGSPAYTGILNYVPRNPTL